MRIRLNKEFICVKCELLNFMLSEYIMKVLRTCFMFSGGEKNTFFGTLATFKANTARVFIFVTD